MALIGFASNRVPAMILTSYVDMEPNLFTRSILKPVVHFPILMPMSVLEMDDLLTKNHLIHPQSRRYLEEGLSAPFGIVGKRDCSMCQLYVMEWGKGLVLYRSIGRRSREIHAFLCP